MTIKADPNIDAVKLQGHWRSDCGVMDMTIKVDPNFDAVKLQDHWRSAERWR